MKRLLIFMLLVILLGFAFFSRIPRPLSTPHPDTAADVRLLKVHFIDVGQGDSILIEGADGTTALIDGGSNNGLALAYLQQIPDIEAIDAMIVSHPHADHLGGLVEDINLR